MIRKKNDIVIQNILKNLKTSKGSINWPEECSRPEFYSKVSMTSFAADADSISQHFADLIDSIPEEVSKSYRVEVDILDGELDIRISFDSTLWYDTMMNRYKFDEVEAMKLANEFTCDCRKKNSIEPFTFAKNYVLVPEYCRHQLTCARDCGKKHLPADKCCPNYIPTSAGRYVCEFFEMDELHLFSIDIENMKFNVSTRKNPVREALIFPNLHISNQQLLCLPIFWKGFGAILARFNQQMVSKIKLAVNFGEWESNIHFKNDARECHGHVHILLEREFIDSITENSNGFSSLRGRIEAPKNYDILNCKELEQNRIFPAVIPNICRDLAEIKQMLSLNIRGNLKE